MSPSRIAALAALILATAAPALAQNVAVLTIALHSYGYQPNPIELRAARPVTLTFVNRAGKGHDFTARKFFAQARILAGNAGGGEIDLNPGEIRRVTLVPAAGRYKVHCGHALHKQLGMRATIVVR